MANFTPAITKVLSDEGGYSNRSNDLGGETYRGISRVNNTTWIGWAGVDAAKKVNGGTLPNNTIIKSPTLEAQAKQLYKSNYWDAIGGDSIKDQAVAEILFDAKLNQTGGFPAMLNNALHLSGHKELPYIPKVTGKDGISVSKILPLINDTSASKLYVNFKNEREKYYAYRASIPGQEENLKGWLKRLSHFDYYKQHPTIAIGAVVIIFSITAVALYFINFSKQKI